MLSIQQRTTVPSETHCLNTPSSKHVYWEPTNVLDDREMGEE